MELRIISIEVYNGCIPEPVYMVQKYVGDCFFGKWVDIKAFKDKEKAMELMKLLRK